jgi:hypothetical protein
MIQIKGYTRIKRGKIERVSPYQREYSDTGEIVTFSEEQFRVLLDKDGKKIYEPADMKAHVEKQRRTEFAQRMWTIGERIGSGKNKLAKPKIITLKDGFKIDSGTEEPVGGKDWSEGWEEKVAKKLNKSAKHIEGQTINELEVDGYKVWTGLPIRKRPVWAGSLKTPKEAKKEKEFEDAVMRETDTIWDYIGDNVHYVVIEKSKQIFVPAGKKKAYYRFDPREKKLGEPISSKNIGIIGTHHKVEGRQTLASLEIHKEFMDKYISEGISKEEASKKALDDVRSPEGQKKIKDKIKEIMSRKIGEPYVAEPPGGFEHPDSKYLSVVRKLSGEEKIEETKPEKEFQRRESGGGRRQYRSARSARRSHSTIRRIGS